MVLHFGKIQGQPQLPGLHLKIPFVDTVLKVAQQRQMKHEFGFRTAQAGVRTRYEAARYTDESMMLTGDLNVANGEWIVQYRVSNPYE